MHYQTNFSKIKLVIKSILDTVYKRELLKFDQKYKLGISIDRKSIVQYTFEIGSSPQKEILFPLEN